jgi:hypothetical protein
MRGLASRAGAFTLLVGLLAPAASATAQGTDGRFSAWITGGAQAVAPSLDERFTFRVHAEDAQVDTDYRSAAGVFVDGGFAFRLRGDIGVGVAISRSGGDSRASIAAQIPYPFDFNRFRDVSGSSSGLEHTELSYHLQLRYARPLARRLRLVIFGGPSVFSVRRQIVTEVQVDEEYPFDTATFRGATVRAAKGTGPGFNAGADFVWMMGRRAGVGAMVRYARGAADLSADLRTLSADTGGVQSGVGLRLYF